MENNYFTRDDRRFVYLRDGLIALAIAAVVIVLMWVIYASVNNDRETKTELKIERVKACQTVSEASARAGCITFAGR